MKLKDKLLFIAVFLVLAIPLIVAGNAGAVYNSDGATHNASGAWDLSGLFCVGVPQGYVSGAATAVTRPDLPATYAGCQQAATAAQTTALNAAYTTQAACNAAGYYYDAFNAPGTQCVALFVTTNSPSGAGWVTDENACLHCHSTGQFADVIAQQYNLGFSGDKSSYLKGGHKNMSRPADGLPWGMPGVDSTHQAPADLTASANLDSFGLFTLLWLQEDYPRMAVNWGAKTKSMTYCAVSSTAKDSFGNYRTTQAYGLDAAVAAADSSAGYESPILGDAGWGYPLNYKNSADCASANFCQVTSLITSATCTAAKSQSPVSKSGLANGQVAYNWDAVTSRCIDPTVTNSADCAAYGNAGEARSWTAGNFVWYDASVSNSAYSNPLMWIYGGAGLEGGPGMMQPGTQYYWCARCHTTGWTTSGATAITAASYPDQLPYTAFGTCAGGTGGTNKAACTAGGGTWTPASELFGNAVGGGSKLLAAGMTAGSTTTTNESWDQWGIECSRCHVATNGGHATWPAVGTPGQANKTTAGDVVALCMNCHRQEDIKDGQRGQPKHLDGIGNGSTGANTVAKSMAAVWSQRINQPDGFWHHPDGNEFLNSPHAQFTGAWNQIGCPPIAVDTYTSVAPYNGNGCTADGTTGLMDYSANAGTSSTSLYKSKFAKAVATDLGINSSTAGGCTSCHDAHKSVNENSSQSPTAGATVSCTNCHSNLSATVSPQINILAINHMGGVGTPLQNAATDPSESCTICHQPPGIKHIWRINTDATYKTYAQPFSTNGAFNGANPSNTAPDANGRDAVWVDLDSACGQCHGGGTNNTTGLPDEREYPRESASYFDGSKGGTILAPYFSKADLATIAAGMHSYSTCTSSVSFTSSPSGLTVNVTASVPSCSPATYDWNWGDATAHGSGASTSHAYAAAGTYTVGLIVKDSNGLIIGSTTNSVTVTALDNPPTASATCTWNANTWTASVTDTSTDTDVTGVSRVVVTWGDGNTDVISAGATKAHTYSVLGSYTPTVRAIDSALQSSTTVNCTGSTPFVTALSSITGTVRNAGNTANLSFALVTLRKGSATGPIAGQVSTNMLGTFTFTNLKPNTYFIVVTKSGYTFGAAPSVTVGPNSSGTVINSN